MSFPIKILWIMLALSFCIGLTAMATWGIPAPTGQIKVDYDATEFLKTD